MGSRRNLSKKHSKRHSKRHSKSHSKKRLKQHQKRRLSQRGGGRTINIPFPDGTGSIPGPSYNSAVTIGEACVGSHCAIPVTPSTDNMMSNLNSQVPGASLNYPGTDRMGNNHFMMPGISPYVGTQLNNGPFTMLTQAGGSRRRRKH